KLGATAWSLLANPYRDLADEMARSVVGADRFRQSTAEWLPWEDYLADPANLQAALAQAGLRDVTVEEIEYPIHITIADFLTTRGALLVAAAWLASNPVMDYPMFAYGPMRMTAASYYSDIGIAYLAIPAVALAAARMARACNPSPDRTTASASSAPSSISKTA